MTWMHSRSETPRSEMTKALRLEIEARPELEDDQRHQADRAIAAVETLLEGDYFGPTSEGELVNVTMTGHHDALGDYLNLTVSLTRPAEQPPRPLVDGIRAELEREQREADQSARTNTPRAQARRARQENETMAQDEARRTSQQNPQSPVTPAKKGPRQQAVEDAREEAALMQEVAKQEGPDPDAVPDKRPLDPNWTLEDEVNMGRGLDNQIQAGTKEANNDKLDEPAANKFQPTEGSTTSTRSMKKSD